ncbi:hypothetical protein [Sphingobacterium multivorum]|uniref:hypothetical protein n=1 Tax=Sphingobacterium multivorum TaxID=28454 RepID=UPI00345E4EA8
MENRVVFYLPKDALFEATTYYCNLIKQAVEEIAPVEEVLYVSSIDEILKEDTVITIRIDDPFLLFKRCKKIIHWFQGIAPEERILMGKGSLYSRLAALKYGIMELILLKKNYFFFFVSEAMKEHYEKKYRIDLTGRHVIMPCYNIALNKRSFEYAYKYTKPKFVYAGGVLNWQCVEESLMIYKAFKQIYLDATFTILTKDSDKANALIQKLGAKDVFVKFVPLKSLQDELSMYKYGFLLRKQHVVNKVATPTKMNSYLAAGVIPIYTSVVDDFDRNINLGEFEIKCDTIDVGLLTTKLVNFERKNIHLSDVFSTFERVFEEYYNDLKYKQKIKELLIHYLITR